MNSGPTRKASALAMANSIPKREGKIRKINYQHEYPDIEIKIVPKQQRREIQQLKQYNKQKFYRQITN